MLEEEIKILLERFRSFSKIYGEKKKERKKENEVTRKEKCIRGATRTKYAWQRRGKGERGGYELVRVHHKSYCPPLTEFVEVFSLRLTLAPLSTQAHKAPTLPM